MENYVSNGGLSLNVDGSEDYRMKLQGQGPEKPNSILIWWLDFNWIFAIQIVTVIPKYRYS